jgi:LETM1 and EF-hand domain-containing protein 1, mitochondrial
VFYEIPSSKLEITVKSIKDKEQEQIKTHQAQANNAKLELKVNAAKEPDLPAPLPVAKKSLTQRIWAEIVHYYHGFRLLWIDINVSRKLLWRVLMGKTLSRREHRLLVRTTSDLFRYFLLTEFDGFILLIIFFPFFQAPPIFSVYNRPFYGVTIASCY